MVSGTKESNKSKGMTGKQVVGLIILTAVAAFVFGRLSTQINWAVLFSGGPTSSIDFVVEEPGPAPEDSPLVPANDAPFLGRATAKVTIVEFSDFQCGYCARAMDLAHIIMEDYEEGEVRFVYRNFPIARHSEAAPAARAALAANEQGRFWEYHDLLFAHQSELSSELMESFATDLGLDMSQFRSSWTGDETEAALAHDVELFRTLGFNGTPSFVINGRVIVGAPLSDFLAVIDEEIAEVDDLLADGVPMSEVYRRRVEVNRQAAEAEDGEEVDDTQPTPSDETGESEDEPPGEQPQPEGEEAQEDGADALERLTLATEGLLNISPHPDERLVLIPAEIMPDRAEEGTVRIEIYADYSSPEYPPLGQALQRLHDDYGDDIQLQFQAFFEPSNETAMLVSAALSAAEEQGSLMDFHRFLIMSEQDLTRENLENLALQTNLDLELFRTALEQFEQPDEAPGHEGAHETDISVTPTVFVGDYRMVGSIPFEDLRVAVNTALEQ